MARAFSYARNGTIRRDENERVSMELTVPEITAMLREADEEKLASLERALAADERKGVKSALAKARKRIDAQKAQLEHDRKLYAFEERIAAEHGGSVIVGLDEVGRGSVAGPLAVGAVVLPREPMIRGLDDSKKLSPTQREMLAESIKNTALACEVVFVEARRIDAIGMSAALREAFSRAIACIDGKGLDVDTVLIDGNPLRLDPREVNVVKGDGKCASIAAASILAKVTRDALMVELAQRYPGYGFEESKGYASPSHIEAIRSKGLTPVHRASFCTSFMQQTLF